MDNKGLQAYKGLYLTSIIYEQLLLNYPLFVSPVWPTTWESKKDFTLKLSDSAPCLLLVDGMCNDIKNLTQQSLKGTKMSSLAN